MHTVLLHSDVDYSDTEQKKEPLFREERRREENHQGEHG